jgi:hypothetical protein
MVWKIARRTGRPLSDFSPEVELAAFGVPSSSARSAGASTDVYRQSPRIETGILETFGSRFNPEAERCIEDTIADFISKGRAELLLAGLALPDFFHSGKKYFGLMETILRYGGKRVKILLLDPTSEPARLREVLGRDNAIGNVWTSLRKLLEYERRGIEVHLYQDIPTYFVLKTDSTMLVEPYHHGFGVRSKDETKEESFGRDAVPLFVLDCQKSPWAKRLYSHFRFFEKHRSMTLEEFVKVQRDIIDGGGASGGGSIHEPDAVRRLGLLGKLTDVDFEKLLRIRSVEIRRAALEALEREGHGIEAPERIRELRKIVKNLRLNEPSLKDLKQRAIDSLDAALLMLKHRKQSCRP